MPVSVCLCPWLSIIPCVVIVARVNISASPLGGSCDCIFESEQQVAPLLNQPSRVDSLHTELSAQ